MISSSSARCVAIASEGRKQGARNSSSFREKIACANRSWTYGVCWDFRLRFQDMKRRLFTDMNVVPTDALLRRHLGNAFQYYETILQASAVFVGNGNSAEVMDGS